MQDPNLKADEAIDEKKVDTPEMSEETSDDETKGDKVPEEVEE